MRPTHALASVTFATVAAIACRCRRRGDSSVPRSEVSRHTSSRPRPQAAARSPANEAVDEPAHARPGAPTVPPAVASHRDRRPTVATLPTRSSSQTATGGRCTPPRSASSTSPSRPSPDLATWSPPIDALPELPTWAEWGRTWAPGVLARPGGFVLYFAARSRGDRSAVHRRRHLDVGHRPVHQLVQPSRWCASPNSAGRSTPIPSSMRTARRTCSGRPTGTPSGTPASCSPSAWDRPDSPSWATAVPLLRNDASWEAPLIENPALLRPGRALPPAVLGRLVGVGQLRHRLRHLRHPARAVHEGHRPSMPLHASDPGVAGPGGATVITGPAGDMWLAHHGWAPGSSAYTAAGRAASASHPCAGTAFDWRVHDA